jgi:hypothetical protein
MYHILLLIQVDQFLMCIEPLSLLKANFEQRIQAMQSRKLWLVELSNSKQEPSSKSALRPTSDGLDRNGLTKWDLFQDEDAVMEDLE